MLRQCGCGFLQPIMYAVMMMRGRAAHDIALHVTASTQRGQQAFINASDGFFEMTLEHPMQLNALTRGESKRPVAISARQIVHGQILFRCQSAARNLAADHEDVFFAFALFAAGFSGIAVILLISAMELK